LRKKRENGLIIVGLFFICASMFTGIIQEIGTIKNIQKDAENLKIQIACLKILKNKKIGDSIAVDGCCQTVTGIFKDSFEVQAIPETLRCTNFKNFKKGTKVNLESSLKVGDSLDGHFVLGHVDDITICYSHKNSKNGYILTFGIPKNLKKYIVYKGSVAINGVSLTIAKVEQKSYSIAIIPYTLENTNLGSIKEGDEVNVEGDVLAKYNPSGIIDYRLK